jgi:hypothetical protein
VQPTSKAPDQFRLSTQQAFQRTIPPSLAASGFATRFFNDRQPAERGGGGGQRLSNQMLVDPPPGLLPPNHAEFFGESRENVLVGGPKSSRLVVEPSYRAGQSSSSRESLEEIGASHNTHLGEADGRKHSSRGGGEEKVEDNTRATYRIVSELLPRSTQLIHEAILESGRPEVILEAGQLRKHSRDSSCTCYQCHHEAESRKHSSASIFHDENCNIALPSGNRFFYGFFKYIFSNFAFDSI